MPRRLSAWCGVFILLAASSPKEATRLTDSDLQSDLQTIQTLGQTTRMPDVFALAEQMRAKWRNEEPRRYGNIMTAMLGQLVNRATDRDRAAKTAGEYAEEALGKADLMDLDTRVELMRHLEVPSRREPRATIETQTWTRRRKAQATAILQTVGTIQKGRDDSWNPADLPQVNLAPPAATGLPSGVSPDAIQDPALRALYEQAINDNEQKALRHREQTAIRRLEAEFLPWAVNYLLRLYQHGESDTELRGLCDEYGVAPSWQDSLLEKMTRRPKTP